MTIINLIEEVIANLQYNGKTLDYDNKFGFECIPGDLCIVGDAWWLSRAEYDGSVWFRYNEKPPLPVYAMTLEDLSSLFLN